MKTTTKSKVEPDYALHPAFMLRDWLEENGMKQDELAARLGMAAPTVSKILNEKEPISNDTAMKIETVTGMPAGVFVSMQARYDEHTARVARASRIASEFDRIKAWPLAEMRRRGVIPALKEPAEIVESVLRFFGVSDTDALENCYGSRLAGAARKSAAFDGEYHAVATWVREAEARALAMPGVPEYSEAIFKEKLLEIRSLTTGKPEDFGNKITELCMEAGVIVAYVKPYTGVPFHGFCRWLHGHPLIVLSDRGKRADKLWFSFFHEAAHILLHGRKDMFFEHKENGKNSKEEREADEWARNTLILKANWATFVKDGLEKTDTEIRAFAHEEDIHAGIIAARLIAELYAQTKDKEVFKRHQALFQSLEIRDKR